MCIIIIHAPLMEKWPPLRISWQNPAYMSIAIYTECCFKVTPVAYPVQLLKVTGYTLSTS